MPRAPLDPNFPSEVTTIRLTRDTMNRVRAMARESDRTIGGQLRHLVREGVGEGRQ